MNEAIEKSFGVPKDYGHTLKEKKMNASFMETLVLGDPDKKKAKTESKQADAEFTRALAQLTQQMALESNQKKAQASNTTLFVIGGLVLILGFSGVAYMLYKRNKG